MRKIAFFGGTFDPVHNGHLCIAQVVTDTLKLDAFYFLPAYAPAHKSFQSITSDKHRMNMLKLAIQSYSKFHIEKAEIVSKGKLKYTIDTLVFLKAKYPDDEIYFVIGGDQAEAFATWRSPEQITEMVQVVSVMRSGFQMSNHFNIRVLPMEYVDISSTEIRRAVRTQASIQAFVPHDIENYIKEHHLYET